MPMARPPKPPARTFETNGFWHWKPSKRLRDEGRFKTVALGGDWKAAFAEARNLNREADAWLEKAGKAKSKADETDTRQLTFGTLLNRYRQSHAFKALRPSTRQTYQWCMAPLEREFADDRCSSINRARVLAWLEPLAERSPQGARHYAAVGRTIFNWARDHDLAAFAANPFDRMGISAGRRAKRALEADLKALVALADAQGRPDLGTAMVVAFFCVQRLWDVLETPASAITEGWITFQQSKTGRTVNMPVPQPVAARLVAHPPKGGLLVHRDGKKLPADRAPLAWSKLRTAAIETARKEEGPASPRAHRLDGLQFRDMRRSGFVFYAEKAGITVHQICAMSGHTIEEGMQIVETYLPKTPEQAAMAIKLAASEW